MGPHERGTRGSTREARGPPPAPRVVGRGGDRQPVAALLGRVGTRRRALRHRPQARHARHISGPLSPLSPSTIARANQPRGFARHMVGTSDLVLTKKGPLVV